MESCDTPVVGRRRVFWSTQPCTKEPDACGDTCESYGLIVQCAGLNGCVAPTENNPVPLASISTENWIRGLALNILLTDGRRAATRCGWRPGSRGGHWSDSYRKGVGAGLTSGSLAGLLTSHGSVSDAVAELRAILQSDMQKLVSYGVAESVAVDVVYVGSNKVRANIDIIGSGGVITNVGVTGQRSDSAWLWDL